MNQPTGEDAYLLSSAKSSQRAVVIAGSQPAASRSNKDINYLLGDQYLLVVDGDKRKVIVVGERHKHFKDQ